MDVQPPGCFGSYPKFSFDSFARVDRSGFYCQLLIVQPLVKSLAIRRIGISADTSARFRSLSSGERLRLLAANVNGLAMAWIFTSFCPAVLSGIKIIVFRHTPGRLRSRRGLLLIIVQMPNTGSFRHAIAKPHVSGWLFISCPMVRPLFYPQVWTCFTDSAYRRAEKLNSREFGGV